ncbi:MAG: choloylglycine hydrolase family protein [Clostridia bacterium]|nr:choloylglycine hydrolase family protein [Clostridia bacterium]
MCTAIKYGNLFGRNFDLDFEFEQNILFTARDFEIPGRNTPALKNHYSIMGMGVISQDFPLYYDAMNEKGLAIAALNFPGFAIYSNTIKNQENIAAFEVIPFVLGKNKSIDEAVEYIKTVNITNVPFSKKYPTTPLHWMLSDKERSVVIEVVSGKVNIYESSADILTNAPSYDIQLFNLSNYMSLSPNPPKNSFSQVLPLSTYSFGMGGMGLPGDLSSMSRFVKGTFLLHNSPAFKSTEQAKTHFFRLLYSVSMTKGAVQTESSKTEYTQYTCCMDLEKLSYTFTSYDQLEPKEYFLADVCSSKKGLVYSP